MIDIKDEKEAYRLGGLVATIINEKKIRLKDLTNDDKNMMMDDLIKEVEERF